MQVAMAAVKLVHQASGAAGEEEIPDTSPVADRAVRDDRPGKGGGRRPPRPAQTSGARMARVFVGAGRSAGIRPQDLVGAVAGETRLQGRDIGAIEIADRFSLVEVPESSAGEVVTALRASTIKGRKATIRLAHESR
jgi:ATP-dependent RNA helicase DeaD